MLTGTSVHADFITWHGHADVSCSFYQITLGRIYLNNVIPCNFGFCGFGKCGVVRSPGKTSVVLSKPAPHK